MVLATFSTNFVEESLPLGKVERYQKYLDENDLNSDEGLEEIYNCSFPWFGSHCEYSFGVDYKTFSNALHNTFAIKTEFSENIHVYEILRVTNGGTCYESLECDRIGNVCLDWREICDGKCDCFNECQDEMNCWQLEESECQTNDFRCRNGQCVPWEIRLEDGELMGCLDKSELHPAYWSDRPGGIEIDDCQLTPFLHCEDSTCSKFAYQFTCGDGQCLDSFPVLDNDSNTVKCKNGRDVYLLKAILNTSRMALSEECWLSMICALQFEHVYSIECNNVTRPVSACGARRLVFPVVPILSNHVFFIYDTERLNKISPNFICYDRQFCEFSVENEQIIKNLTCITFNQSFNQWSDLSLYVGKLFHAHCWTPHQNCSSSTQFRCSSSRNTSKCISRHRLLDRQQDCSLNEDELYSNSCSENLTSRFSCGSLENDRCISQILVRDGKVDCHLTANDEKYSSAINQPIILSEMCDGNVDHTILIDNVNVTDEEDCENYVCRRPGMKCYMSLLDFKPYPSIHTSNISHVIITATNTNKQNERHRMSEEEEEEDYYHFAWHCNTGVLVQPEGKCFCPSSYYGNRCQFQNQRISLAIFVQKPGLSERQSAFRLILQLIDSTEDDRVVAQEQLLYMKRQISFNCDERFDIQLLYPHRPKLLNHSYFIRISAYEIDILKLNKIQYRTSWYSSIPFPFLPVNKLALYLSIPIVEPQISPCDKTNMCIHGECLYYFNSSKYFCHCDMGWSGSKCDRKYDCQCSSGLISVDGPTNCVCPINKFGLLCYITKSECTMCENGATCIEDSHHSSYSHIEPYCLCREGFEGIYCETRQSYLDVSFNHGHINEILSSADLYEIREELTVAIDSTNRCPSIHEFLNETIVSSPQIIRFKHYHEPCQVNFNLKCFYDETQICICHADYHTAACFNFDHHMLYDCASVNYCQNKGKCFQDDRHCPITSTCVCEECFYGSSCQLTTNGFALSLESIIDYLIRPKLTLEKQIGIVKLAFVLTIVMLIIGILLNLFAISTFIQRTTLEIAVGFYLLASSIISLLTMIVFSLKFYTLLATQMALITNPTTININCKAIEYLLKSLPAMVDWLNACVAIERATMIVIGIKFNKLKSITASKFVIFFVILFKTTFAILDPLNRRLIYNEEEDRTWCVVSYLHWPALNSLNSTLNIIDFIVPFALNLISASIIILLTARKRSVLRIQQTYLQHLYVQLQHDKHLILSPCIIVLLAVPRLIISFFTGCMKSERNPWVYFAGYFISYIPPTIIFIIFVIPSKTYKSQFTSELKRYYA
ncbi:hypothetical protein I4U23_011434 [Adineta vaga]|nr:hypothetical protein I4U23_011434 [Adineta vaga]